MSTHPLTARPEPLPPPAPSAEPRSKPDDEDILRLAEWKQGDVAAGHAFYQHNAGPIKKYFRLRVREVQDVADLTQETFLRAQNAEFHGRSAVRTFLFGIASRVFLEHLRRKSRTDELPSPEHQLSMSAADFEADPEYMLRQKQQTRLLMKALRRIELKYQLVIEMNVWEGFTMAEVAEALACPHGTIRRWKTEALVHLQAQMHALDGSGAVREATTGSAADWQTQVKGEAEPFAASRRGESA